MNHIHESRISVHEILTQSLGSQSSLPVFASMATSRQSPIPASLNHSMGWEPPSLQVVVDQMHAIQHRKLLQEALAGQGVKEGVYSAGSQGERSSNESPSTSGG